MSTIETKYLDRFLKLPKEALPLRGNRMLVEVLPNEELTSKGGIVIAVDPKSFTSTTAQNRPKLAVVLATGAGYVDDETGEPIDPDITPGSVVLVSEMGLKYYSQFPGINEYTGEVLALTRESEIHVSWPSIDAYLEYRKLLNS